MVKVRHVWHKDQPIYRIHAAKLGANVFNHSGLGDARFSPLILPDGTIIPTMYGATTFVCSAMETVFHDLPKFISDYIFDFEDLDGAVVSVVAPTRDLNLLPLTTIGLRSMNLEKTDVIETSVDKYPDTREYALDWHQQHPDIDGLYWTSRRDDSAQASVLFGDRVKTAELKVVVDSMSVQETPYIEQLVHLAKQLGISRGMSFPSDILGF